MGALSVLRGIESPDPRRLSRTIKSQRGVGSASSTRINRFLFAAKASCSAGSHEPPRPLPYRAAPPRGETIGRLLRRPVAVAGDSRTSAALPASSPGHPHHMDPPAIAASSLSSHRPPRRASSYPAHGDALTLLLLEMVAGVTPPAWLSPPAPSLLLCCCKRSSAHRRRVAAT